MESLPIFPDDIAKNRLENFFKVRHSIIWKFYIYLLKQEKGEQSWKMQCKNFMKIFWV